MKYWIGFAFCFLAVGRANGGGLESVAYGLGPSEDSSSGIFLRLPSGRRPGQFFSLSRLAGCRGLDLDTAGRLITICEGGEGSYLLRPVEDGMDRALFLETNPSTFRALQDLAFRPNDGLIFLLTFELEDLPIISPGGHVLYALDPATGETLWNVALPPVNGITFSAQSGKMLAVVQDGLSGRLAEIDPESGEIVAARQLSAAGIYQDVAVDPATGKVHALVSAANSSSFVSIEEDGEVTELESLDVSLSLFSLAITAPRPSDGPEQEWILPTLVASQSEGNRRFLTSLTLLNFSNSTAAGQIEFFNSEGSRRQLQELVCPGDAAMIPFPDPGLPPNSQRHLLLSGPPQGFAGWARLRSVLGPPLVPQVELAFVGFPFAGCPRPADSLPSEAVLTTVEVAPVRPAREFAASGAILEFRESGFSIVNPSPSETALIHIVASRDDGTSFDANEIHLAPRHRISLLLFELLIEGKNFLVPPVRPTDFRGQVRFSSDIPIAVGGLQVLLPEGKWSNLPVLEQPQTRED
ncbi:MAG: PQQ-binding-like beta-propeller repeat protein [Acidobacteriota bacterium]